MTDRLTDAEIAEIQARVDAATVGPWERDAWYVVGQVKGGRPGGEVIIQCRFTNHNIDDKQWRARDEGNAVFVAHSRTDIPRLLKDRKAGREREDALEVERDKYDAWCDEELKNVEEAHLALEKAYDALSGDRDDAWIAKIPPEDPPDSGYLHHDVPALARIMKADNARLREGLMKAAIRLRANKQMRVTLTGITILNDISALLAPPEEKA